MKFIKPLLLAVLAAASLGVQAKYNGEDRGRPVMPSEINAKMQSECGRYHMALPPGLLSAASWKKIMTGLDKHFGTDAIMNAADTTEITNYLMKYESNRWTSKAAPLRSTDSEWFKAKHNGEISPAVWKRESIKSPSNCMACHGQADKGNFDEKSIHIPK